MITENPITDYKLSKIAEIKEYLKHKHIQFGTIKILKTHIRIKHLAPCLITSDFQFFKNLGLEVNAIFPNSSLTIDAWFKWRDQR